MRKVKLKTKIILISVITIFAVGFISNMVLYKVLTRIIGDKVANIQTLNLTSVKNQINWRIEEFISLGLTCSNDSQLAKVLNFNNLNTTERKKAGIDAKDVMNNYYQGSMVKNYINKILAFNDEGILIQPGTSSRGYQKDHMNAMEYDIFKELAESKDMYKIDFNKSILKNKNDDNYLIFISKAISPIDAKHVGWVYIELNMNFFYDIITPYNQDYYFVMKNESLVASNSQINIFDEIINNYPIDNKIEIKKNNKIYHVQSRPLIIDNMTIINYSDVTILYGDELPIVYTLVVVMLMMLVATIILAILLSFILTKPIETLTERIKKISKNDFTYDPVIEKGNDEIAEIGKVVNEMSFSIKHLLEKTEKLHVESKKADIALLQSQVNPHFLYNTLDSIRWMAVIQNAPGIEKMIINLSNLLSNLAKGVNDKITIKKEISLLMDYVKIQNIRYMDMFQVDVLIDDEIMNYKTIKFILQPIVENAIFHGLEPIQRVGKIIIDGKLVGKNIIITVYDNGIGIDEKVIKSILKEKSTKTNRGSLSGIGITNVNNRLKLYYGNEYGLSYESEKYKYTLVTITIPQEK